MVSSALITGVANLVLFGLVVAFRWLVHREGPRSFLLHGDADGRRLFLKGAVVALLFFAAYPISVILIGQGNLVANDDGLSVTVACALAWGVGFLPVVLFEEALFRGYLLQKAMARSPRWVAVLVPSLVFGMFHSVSYGSGGHVWLGIVNASLFGVVFSLVVIRSHSLMCAIGLHWAWNLAQQILLLRPNGKHEALFSLQAHESRWVGAHLLPETGIIVTLIVIGLGASMFLWLGQPVPTTGARSRGSVQGASGEERALG
jgi:membrane protease YdiL (CAAX protease family)